MNHLNIWIFVCFLLLYKFCCNCFIGTYTDEQFKEKVMIYRLNHKNRFLLNYELDIIVNKNLNLETPKFIPNELLELSDISFLNKLLVVSTQGNWRINGWGEPPIIIYHPGSMLDANFIKISDITDNIWSIILNKISNLMCNSLNIFNDDLFKEKNCINIKDNNNFDRIVCNNYDDTLCSDNLNCWKKLLPCYSFNMYNKIGSYGILKSISNDLFIKSSYKSIGFEFINKYDQLNYKIFLKIVLNSIDLSLNQNLESWNFWEIHKFDQLSINDILCPAITESKLYYFINYVSPENIISRNQYHEKNHEINCNLILYNHNIYKNLYYLEIFLDKLDTDDLMLDLNFFKYQCGLYWINNLHKFISQLQYNDINLNILEIKRTFANTMNKNLMKHDRTEGSLVISFDNLSNKTINICHWEQFPRYLNPWFYKTKVLYSNSRTIKNIEDFKGLDKVYVLDSTQAIKFLNLNISNSQNIITNFCLDINPNTNIIVIIRYQKPFLSLNYIGSKSQRGQITPPSITFWNIDNNKTLENDDSNESNIYYHNSHIISTINVDHTMKFNVVAITSAFIIFGIIITTKFIQLNNSNIS